MAGVAQLAIDGVLGVTQVVEAMHQTIKSLPRPLGSSREQRASGLTGLVYRSVRGVTRLVGYVLDQSLALGAPLLPAQWQSTQLDALRAALNGAFGDHLCATHNPLAITMQLRCGDTDWTSEDLQREDCRAPVGTRPLLLLHGLCMHDRQWSRQGHDHGQALAAAYGYTPIYLRYNTGLSLADNGAELARMLERCLAPQGSEVESLSMLGHSMGGLLARSALAHALQADMAWPAYLRHVVCLGSPHLGAPLERAGSWIDTLIGISPYSAPLLHLGGSRSRGIKDLRHGRILPAGGAPATRHALPPNAALFLVAGTRSKHNRGRALAGDGLVPVHSALGRHRHPDQSLGVAAARRLVVAECGHFDLLNHARVAAQLKLWLQPG